MPHHVIVDGSNLATEGRTLPSLKQLNEAVASYRSDHPEALITVVVDATFGHRIDPKEVAEFDKLIESNELVAPPAGAVGRGDGFVLSIAQKANASVLSNDSYQEFHGEYAWLFDEGRLLGGKPVPHVGWVFVNRVPVRGPVSRRSIKEQRVVEKVSRGRGRGRSAQGSTATVSADGPMPVPKAPPPGAVMPTPKTGDKAADKSGDKSGDKSSEKTGDRRQGDRQSASQGTSQSADSKGSNAPKSTNDLLPFLSFVEHFPVGTAVTAVVENYSSHGAYVSIGDVRGYVPLRLMGDPAPRSAREAMEVGETVTLVVQSFAASRRSIDLAVPSMAPALPPPAQTKPKRAAARKAVVTELTSTTTPAAAEPPSAPTATAKKSARPARKKAAADAAAPESRAADAAAPGPIIAAAAADAPAMKAQPAKARAPRKKQAPTDTPSAAATTVDAPPPQKASSRSATKKQAKSTPQETEKPAPRRRSTRAAKE